jgi:ATP-dependent Lhr-like helicase
LIGQGRTTVASWVYNDSQRQAYVAAERLSVAKSLLPDARFEPELTRLPQGGEALLSLEDAARKVIHGWMEISGPVTPSALAEKLGLPLSQVEKSLLALELSGVVLRGNFTALGKDSGEIEWCERGLLSRIHRLTLGQLRKEIEPVSASDFIKFLVRWQHVQPGTQLRGRAGVAEVVGQLQGIELPAPAWEQHVLSGRVAEYDPKDLEDLCLAGVVAWGRLRSNGAEESEGAGEKKRRLRRSPSRAAPIAFVLREDLDHFLTAPAARSNLSAATRDVLDYLERHGASFLSDVARGTGLLKIKTEEALWELVAAGLVTGDGIAGLRVLIMPEVERRQRRRRLRVVSGGRAPERLMPVGRWSLWRSAIEAKDDAAEESNEFIGRQLLKRYGVIFRDLLARESCAPPWRSLLTIYRKLEARGEIRGGRFVNGFVGEQFALPEAVDILRAVRRSQEKVDPVIISAADPLNLVGILTPGARVSPYSGESIAYIDGVPAEIGPLGALLSKLQLSGAT